MKLMPILSFLVLFAAGVVGCSEEPTVPPPTPARTPQTSSPQTSSPQASSPQSSATATETSTVKTMDEYRTEASKTITAENAEKQLESLEKEIAADQQ